MARRDCIVCWHRNGRLVRESVPMTRDEASMEAMYGSRDDVAGDVYVTIYRSGRALRGWHMVPAHEVAGRM